MKSLLFKFRWNYAPRNGSYEGYAPSEPASRGLSKGMRKELGMAKRLEVSL